MGMGWGINVHAHVHASSTLISHLVVLDDTSVFQGSTQNISQREVGLSTLNHPDLSSWWLQPQKKVRQFVLLFRKVRKTTLACNLQPVKVGWLVIFECKPYPMFMVKTNNLHFSQPSNTIFEATPCMLPLLLLKVKKDNCWWLLVIVDVIPLTSHRWCFTYLSNITSIENGWC